MRRPRSPAHTNAALSDCQPTDNADSPVTDPTSFIALANPYSNSLFTDPNGDRARSGCNAGPSEIHDQSDARSAGCRRHAEPVH